eukprot:632507-Pelagomonas_calceolata.AAC.1
MRDSTSALRHCSVPQSLLSPPVSCGIPLTCRTLFVFRTEAGGGAAVAACSWNKGKARKASQLSADSHRSRMLVPFGKWRSLAPMAVQAAGRQIHFPVYCCVFRAANEHHVAAPATYCK